MPCPAKYLLTVHRTLLLLLREEVSCLTRTSYLAALALSVTPFLASRLLLLAGWLAGGFCSLCFLHVFVPSSLAGPACQHELSSSGRFILVPLIFLVPAYHAAPDVT